MNYRLDTAGYPVVGDLVEDLRDGVALNRLLEALSGVTELLRHVHYNPRHPAHRMANLSAALNFATGRDGLNPKPIRLENIGAEDINDGNRVLIMGLLWSIILQYQIALFGYSPTGMVTHCLVVCAAQLTLSRRGSGRAQALGKRQARQEGG